VSRAINFGAGPAALPDEVLRAAAAGVIELGSSGMSVLEISHRAAEYQTIQDDARERLLRLLELPPAQYTVLFLGGGASLQFHMVPLNFLEDDRPGGYVDTGVWSGKAIEQAQLVGRTEILASSAMERYARLPDLDREALRQGRLPCVRYLHLTTNNTIEGTQWADLPDLGNAPLIVDASSDLLACARDHSRFSMIYAGAQKNAGPAGVTLVVLKRDLLDTARNDLPAMLSYRVHAREDSLYNTPPVFAVYAVALMCRWIEERGGVAAMDALNRRKAAMVYSALDAHPDVYEPTVVETAHRSSVNITWRIRDPARDGAFLAGAQDRGMVGLRGHRVVGGFRASMYNASPEAWAERLAGYLDDFARGERDR
jgi:phosphoserine aminotransferase